MTNIHDFFTSSHDSGSRGRGRAGGWRVRHHRQALIAPLLWEVRHART
jgi:hypothetical protein